MTLEDLKIEYDKLQEKYGAKELNSIYNGGCEENPDICFVFMNPTGRNIACDKSWKGRKSPWLGTKNIWKLFFQVNLISDSTYNMILSKKPKDWDYEFCDFVYGEIKNNKVYPVYYPVGNGIFNIDKSIEDINWIIGNEIIKR